jgi:hypothetical protein
LATITRLLACGQFNPEEDIPKSRCGGAYLKICNNWMLNKPLRAGKFIYLLFPIKEK